MTAGGRWYGRLISSMVAGRPRRVRRYTWPTAQPSAGPERRAGPLADPGQLSAALVLEQAGDGELQLLVRVGAFRHAEALADVGRRPAGVPRSGTSFRNSASTNATSGDRHGGEEDDVQRVRVGVDDRRDLLRLGRRAAPRAWSTAARVDAGRRGDAAGSVSLQDVGVDGAEDRRAERAAERAEERHAGRGDAEVAVVGGVLHDDRQDLHGQPDAGAEHQHVEGHHPVRRVRVQPGQQVQPDRHHQRRRRSGTSCTGRSGRRWCRRRSRCTSSPMHQRQGPQPRRGRRDALDVLQVRRQERHRAEHREADDERQHDADDEHRRAEQPQRQDRVDRAALDEDEHRQRHAASRRTDR